MQRRIEDELEKRSHVAERLDRRKDVSTWFQEHTNLCIVVATAGGSSTDAEAHRRLKAHLLASVERGRNLVGRAFDNDDVFLAGAEPISMSQVSGMSQSSAASAGGAGGSAASLVRRPPSSIPLSGVHRFDEQQGSNTGGAGTSSKPKALACHGVSTNSQIMPLPSRTYLKKSGT